MNRRRDACMAVAGWVEDMLDINGIEQHQRAGYDWIEFQHDGFDMVIKIATRRTAQRRQP